MYKIIRDLEEQQEQEEAIDRFQPKTFQSFRSTEKSKQKIETFKVEPNRDFHILLQRKIHAQNPSLFQNKKEIQQNNIKEKKASNSELPFKRINVGKFEKPFNFLRPHHALPLTQLPPLESFTPENAKWKQKKTELKPQLPITSRFTPATTLNDRFTSASVGLSNRFVSASRQPQIEQPKVITEDLPFIRKTEQWSPSVSLCKLVNVPPPQHIVYQEQKMSIEEMTARGKYADVSDYYLVLAHTNQQQWHSNDKRKPVEQSLDASKKQKSNRPTASDFF